MNLRTLAGLWMILGSFSSFALPPKPFAVYCDQPEVIIPNASQEQVVSHVISRLKAAGTSVIVIRSFSAAA